MVLHSGHFCRASKLEISDFLRIREAPLGDGDCPLPPPEMAHSRVEETLHFTEDASDHGHPRRNVEVFHFDEGRFKHGDQVSRVQFCLDLSG